MTTTAVAPVPPAERTLPAMLARGAERFADRPLLAFGAERRSHAEVLALARARAARLRADGVEAGDRVALLCANRLEMLEAVLGCAWLGAIAVPINTASMAPQIAYVLADSGARRLVVEAGLLARLDGVELATMPLEAIEVVGAGTPAVDAVGGVRCVAWEDAPTRDGADDAAPRVVGADPFAILYTSGTTGPPKGVLCSHAQLHAWGANSADVLGVDADDVLATTLPLFHINALNTLAQASLAGACVAYETRFSASAFWPAMRAAGATVVYLLGAMVPILLARPPSDDERRHRVRIGLGPGVPAEAAAAFHARTGVPLLEGYGSTETNFVIATALERRSPASSASSVRPSRSDSSPPALPTASALRSPPGSMGRLRPGFDARVVDPRGAEVPPGTAGELVLFAADPLDFAGGYLGQPEATATAWRDGWFHTGDRVVRDADGTFRFVDRLKDAIRRRGENISSFEVEQALLGHPAVAACAVYPVRSQLAEDEVMAALVARDGCAIDPAEVAAFCASRLPRFALPRYVDVVAELPRTENGKVQKFRLRERGVTPTTWDREGAPG